MAHRSGVYHLLTSDHVPGGYPCWHATWSVAQMQRFGSKVECPTRIFEPGESRRQACRQPIHKVIYRTTSEIYISVRISWLDGWTVSPSWITMENSPRLGYFSRSGTFPRSCNTVLIPLRSSGSVPHLSSRRCDTHNVPWERHWRDVCKMWGEIISVLKFMLKCLTKQVASSFRATFHRRFWLQMHRIRLF